MPIRHQADDDWGEGDPDGDDFDQDWENDEEDDPTVSCPHCGRAIFEDASKCPHCGQYTSNIDASPQRKPLWIVVGALACLYMMWRSIFG